MAKYYVEWYFKKCLYNRNEIVYYCMRSETE